MRLTPYAYVHIGLKFGMYSDAGSKTCLGLPGSRGKEELDAQSFADLGVDFLKYDNCHAPASDWIVDRYSAMRDALNKTGRPILFSMCNWGAGDPWEWAQKVDDCHSSDKYRAVDVNVACAFGFGTAMEIMFAYVKTCRRRCSQHKRACHLASRAGLHCMHDSMPAHVTSMVELCM